MSKTVKIIFIVLGVLLLAVIAYPIVSYFIWQSNFEKNLSQTTCTSNIAETINLDDKFKDFVLSSDDVTYVELSPNEVVTLLKGTNVIEGLTIKNICAVPAKGMWSIYTSLSIENVNLPWLRIDIAKDDMESAQLYVKKIYIGGMELPDKIAASIKVKLNTGIADALTLVNENNFIGRVIENIELLDSKIVVKGALQ